MESKVLNAQDQGIQTNNEIEKGESDMNQQQENTVETSELGNDETSETIVQSTEVEEEIDIITDMDDATENQLPEGVTEGPRNKEEMHMGLIREWPNAVQVYLKVSDDAGEVLGNKVQERKVKQFCDQYADPKAEIKDPAKVLESAKDLATLYTLQINMVESGLTGTITKYRIRQGMVFIIMKRLVKATKGPEWTEWFKENFDPREFRSVQDYMRLAKIPGITKYHIRDYLFRLQLEDYLYQGLKMSIDDLLGADRHFNRSLVNIHYYVLLEELINQKHKELGITV